MVSRVERDSDRDENDDCLTSTVMAEQQQQQQQQQSASSPKHRKKSKHSSTASSTMSTSSTTTSVSSSTNSLRSRLKNSLLFRSINNHGKDSVAAAPPVAATSSEEFRDVPAAATSSGLGGATESLMQRQTRIVALVETPKPLPPSYQIEHNDNNNSTLLEQKGEQDNELDNYEFEVVPVEPYGPFCASAALLRHSYLERMCGVDTRQIQQEDVSKHLDRIPDDPTVQESIECVFAAQQELLLETDEQQKQPHPVDSSSIPTNGSRKKDLQTPSSIHQSLLKSRLNSHLPLHLRLSSSSSSAKSKLPWKASSTTTLPPQQPIVVVHSVSSSATTNSANIAKAPPPPPCECQCRLRPILDPEQWPQRPLLLRPTPYGGTVVKGIRFAGQPHKYIWPPQAPDASEPPENKSLTRSSSRSQLSWPNALKQHWQRNNDNKNGKSANHTDGARIDDKNTNGFMCRHCMILPINNGKELPGESLVVDFESDLFDGTMLVRLRDCHGTTSEEQENTKGYFDGLHRRYQVVVRGRFKREIPWTECLAGFLLEHPSGKLPSKWIINGALNVVRFFAPLLQTSINGSRPYSLTPLGSTPQALIVGRDCVSDHSMEINHEEPTDSASTLMGNSSTATSSLQRARHRKKLFDKLYVDQGAPSSKLMTDPTKVYTFEFLQHLLSFDDFSIELGSILGSIPLQNILNGQPLQIMASHKHPVPNEPNAVQNRLWCFDIWHEMLIPDAIRLEKAREQAAHTK